MTENVATITTMSSHMSWVKSRLVYCFKKDNLLENNCIILSVCDSELMIYYGFTIVHYQSQSLASANARPGRACQWKTRSLTDITYHHQETLSKGNDREKDQRDGGETN